MWCQLRVVFALFLVKQGSLQSTATVDVILAELSSGKRIFPEADQNESFADNDSSHDLSYKTCYNLVEYSRADCCFEYFLISRYTFGRLLVRLPRAEYACTAKAVMYGVRFDRFWPPDRLALACCRNGEDGCPWKNWTTFSLDNTTESSALCRQRSLLEFKKESFIAVNYLFNIKKDQKEEVGEVATNEYQIDTREVVAMWVCILFFWLMYVGHFAWTLFEDRE